MRLTALVADGDRMTQILRSSLAAVLLSLPLACSAVCWEQAAETYGIPAKLLYAVAGVESNLNPAAMNLSHRNRTGTYDIGLMQINSGHLSRLAKFGITEVQLKEPCTNVKVGAWLLSDLFTRYGVTCDAVGAYNAACNQLKGDACIKARSNYAWKVYQRMTRAEASSNSMVPLKRPTSGALVSLASIPSVPPSPAQLSQ